MCCQQKHFALEADPGFQSGLFHHYFWEKKSHWNCSNFLIAYVDYIKESVYLQTVRNVRKPHHLNILYSLLAVTENNSYAKKNPKPKKQMNKQKNPTHQESTKISTLKVECNQ